jgi:hypothetical protein
VQRYIAYLGIADSGIAILEDASVGGPAVRAAQPVSAAAPRIEDYERRINVRTWGVRSTGQCNTACSLSAGVWKPKVFRGR